MTATAPMKKYALSIERPSACASILAVKGPTDVVIRAGTTIDLDGRTVAFADETQVHIRGDLEIGRDYEIGIDGAGQPVAALATGNRPIENGFIAGFHFAPGGNAPTRGGGDSVAAINPFSLWDIGFRPACPDPRGMALVDAPRGYRFWADIYLLGVEHRQVGTSRFGEEIADGGSLDVLDYETASDIYAGHGKRLMNYDEFRTAAFGVTEKSAAPRDPKKTGLDSPGTSRFGLMQATGNLWVWGTDGDPEDPRPSIFGGSWVFGSNAGSRCAELAHWPECSYGNLSARGACDHL